MTEKPTTARVRTGLLLEISLLGGLYLVTGAVVLLGASFFMPVALALGSHVNGAVLIITQLVAVGSVPAIMIIYFSIFTLRRSGDRQRNTEISRAEAPRLWAAVTEVAMVVGTAPPATLRLSAMANATVFE